MKNNIIAIIIAITGVFGIFLGFASNIIPIPTWLSQGDAIIFMLSLCAFGLSETIKRKQYLFSILIGLMAAVFIFGLISMI